MKFFEPEWNIEIDLKSVPQSLFSGEDCLGQFGSVLENFGALAGFRSVRGCLGVFR